MIQETINRRSKLPYYQQLYEILRGKILRKEWKPGDMIPPESELIDQYQVSRSTVRQVLDILVQEGLIYRQRGRGTFVSHPTLEQSMSRIVSFTEDMQQRGFVPGTRVLGSSIIPANHEIAQKLDIQTGAELARLSRLRMADGEPMSIEHAHLVHRYCPGVLNSDYANIPLRRTLFETYDLNLVYAKQTIRAVAADTQQSNLLEIPKGAPLLLIERITYSQESVAIEFLEIYYRNDRYALYTELRD